MVPFLPAGAWAGGGGDGSLAKPQTAVEDETRLSPSLAGSEGLRGSDLPCLLLDPGLDSHTVTFLTPVSAVGGPGRELALPQPPSI